MPVEHAALEARLRAAAADATWPATPDLRAAVAARLAAAGGSATPAAPPIAPAWGARRPTRPLVRALVLALVALVVLAGVAAALGYRLPGMDIFFVDRVPVQTPATGAAVVEAELIEGNPTPLAEARAVPVPRVLVPGALPEPTTAFVLGAGERRLVTLAWAARKGESTIDGSDLALILTAANGRIEQPLLRKALGRGSTIEPVMVAGDRGWWIAGAPHELFIVDAGGEVELVASRLSGDTLVFERGGTVYRVESALGKDATIAIAETLR